MSEKNYIELCANNGVEPDQSAIKAGSPCEHTFVITHCNGAAGYLDRVLALASAAALKFLVRELIGKDAVIALGGIPNKTQVGDHGIDGRIYPVSAAPAKKGKETGHLDFMDEWYPIQVKQKDKVVASGTTTVQVRPGIRDGGLISPQIGECPAGLPVRRPPC